MTAALREPPLRLFGDGRESVPAHGERTLEERLEAAWSALEAGAGTECPVCRAEMTFDGAAGHCSGCGAVLS